MQCIGKYGISRCQRSMEHRPVRLFASKHHLQSFTDARPLPKMKVNARKTFSTSAAEKKVEQKRVASTSHPYVYNISRGPSVFVHSFQCLSYSFRDPRRIDIRKRMLSFEKSWCCFESSPHVLSNIIAERRQLRFLTE